MTEALEGAEVCVVGHSNTVGKPLALLLLNRNATTTVTHVYTSNRGNLAKHTRVADYLVVAAGVPHLVGADLVKEGAVVLDVGINRVVVCPACGALNRGKKNPCKSVRRRSGRGADQDRGRRGLRGRVRQGRAPSPRCPAAWARSPT